MPHSTPKEMKQVRDDQRLGLAVMAMWIVPGAVVAVVFNSAVPVALAGLGAAIHFTFIIARLSSARRERRRQFWGGHVDTPDLMHRTVVEEIRRGAKYP